MTATKCPECGGQAFTKFETSSVTERLTIWSLFDDHGTSKVTGEDIVDDTNWTCNQCDLEAPEQLQERLNEMREDMLFVP